MRFLKMSPHQRSIFDQFKTTAQMHHHGPLKKDQEVPVHEHDRALYLLAEGEAQYVTSDGKQSEVLGARYEYDAVVVDAGEEHGWISLAIGTVIEHVVGHGEVDMVLAPAA